MLRLGYNTTGFARAKNMAQIVETIHDLGYVGLELTMDKGHYHPLFSDRNAQKQLARQVTDYDLAIVLNSGGRFVLSNVAHEPSLVSGNEVERDEFVKFLVETIKIAPNLGARIIHLHSGALPNGVDPEAAWDWLVTSVAYLAEEAMRMDIVLGFEFHPAMFIATLDDYRRLKKQVNSPALKLTLDIGHVECTETRSISKVIEDCKEEIVNVHLEDIKDRTHVHLPIGQGHVDFADVFNGLKSVNYQGLISAEFNTNDLEVDECLLARKTLEYLHPLL
ncbi:MAG: sugar phosphate isomerase/epimerase [Chloroflexi bacterium]|nr:sugar phosphate isomerase/epimerase [Chloroflexota bacterium]